MKSKSKIISAFVFKETFKSFGVIIFLLLFLLGQFLFNFLYFGQLKNAVDFKSEQILIIVNIAFLLAWILFFQSWFNFKFFRKNLKDEIIRLEYSSLVKIRTIFFLRFFINQFLSIFVIIISWLMFLLFLLISKAEWAYYFKLVSPLFMVGIIVNLIVCSLSIFFQVIIPFVFSFIILASFVTSLSISDLSANLHFKTTNREDQVPRENQAIVLNRQSIAIDQIVETYNLVKENAFMSDLIESFQFWNYAFKNDKCENECKIEDEDINDLYTAIFDDYLFLDLNFREFPSDNRVDVFSINWTINGNMITWNNEMIAKKLRPLEVFYYVNKKLDPYYLENNFVKTREEDWTNSIFNQTRESNIDVFSNVFSSNNIYQTLLELDDNDKISPSYSNKEILEVYEMANNFIQTYYYQNLQSISPLDLKIDNSKSYFYNNEDYEGVNDIHNQFEVSSGERVLTTTILSFVRNATNYNFNLFNQKEINQYQKRQKTNVGLNFMSQFWIMNNMSFTDNVIEYHKANGSLIKAANKYYNVKVDEKYEPGSFIVRTNVNELVDRKVKIDEYKHDLIAVWIIYVIWFLIGVLILIFSYLLFRRKFLNRRKYAKSIDSK